MNPKVWESYLLKPGAPLRLSVVSTESTDWCADKQSARRTLRKYKKEIDELLYRMPAQKSGPVLAIFQGTDASGKDGVVRHVLTGLNPQYCKVTSFDLPAGEELEHDYLWRVHRAMPAYGQLGAFNRSQYEDLLVPRVHGALSRRAAKLKLRQIIDIERLWAENGVVIRKFFLNISPEEQADRFKARLNDPHKQWKVKESDFVDRKLWNKFQYAYQEILLRRPAASAPWYIIPSDRKWYRDIAVAAILLATLRKMAPRFPEPRLNRKRLEV